MPQVFLIRHGDTEWSRNRRHTGRTEIPLSPEGEANAARLAPRLAGSMFGRVFTSPSQRARRTCELAGWGAAATVDPDLAEWDYGDYEGLRSDEILRLRPGWDLFRDGCPRGESPQQVCDRADRLVARLRAFDGTTALFTHGHFGRVIGARWVGLTVGAAERLLLDTASISVLGYEHDERSSPVLALWNECPGRTP